MGESWKHYATWKMSTAEGDMFLIKYPNKTKCVETELIADCLRQRLQYVVFLLRLMKMS